MSLVFPLGESLIRMFLDYVVADLECSTLPGTWLAIVPSVFNLRASAFQIQERVMQTFSAMHLDRSISRGNRLFVHDWGKYTFCLWFLLEILTYDRKLLFNWEVLIFATRSYCIREPNSPYVLDKLVCVTVKTVYFTLRNLLFQHFYLEFILDVLLWRS